VKYPWLQKYQVTINNCRPQRLVLFALRSKPEVRNLVEILLKFQHALGESSSPLQRLVEIELPPFINFLAIDNAEGGHRPSCRADLAGLAVRKARRLLGPLP